MTNKLLYLRHQDIIMSRKIIILALQLAYTWFEVPILEKRERENGQTHDYLL